MALAAVNASICSLKEEVRAHEARLDSPPHPEQLRQLQALKKQVEEAEKRRVVSIAELHSKYYSFGQVTWMTRCMQHLADKYPEQPLMGMQLYEKFFPRWLIHHWGNGVKSPELNVEVLGAVASKIQMDLYAPQSFEDIVQLLYEYEQLHLETEQSAGFSSKELAKFSKIFNRYDKNGDGLQARALWAILSDMGIHLRETEEQNWLIDVVKYLDKDHSGTFDFQEYCQLLRKIDMRYVTEEREREKELILGSGIDLEEVVGWYDVFHESDKKRQGQLTMGEVYKLCETVGVKLDFQSKDKVTQWIREVDTNNNNMVEFGEFVVLISRIVKENLCGIQDAAKEATKEAGKKKLAGDISPEEGISYSRILGDRWSKLSIDIDHLKGPHDLISAEVLEPASPTTKAAVDKLEEALRDSAAPELQHVVGG